MRKMLAFLIFVLFVCLANPSEARNMALLVGVDNYFYVSPNLRCCANDMETLRGALLNIGFRTSDIQILTTRGEIGRETPVKRIIEERVKELLDQTRSSDMVFIAFSGHGYHEDETDYFCPLDADSTDIPGTCVSISQVMEDLSNCRAKFKWMVVDACRSLNSRAAKGIEVVAHVPTGIALFQSCAKGQQSYEEERAGGNGYFTKNLAKALSGAADEDGDGTLTLNDVVQWTIDRTQAEVREKEFKTQTPFFSGSRLDFPLKEARLSPGPAPYAPSPFPRSPLAGDRVILTVNDVEFAFRYCPPGEFMMGSPEDEEGRYDEEKQHKVKITQGFWLLETEVTQAQWTAIMGTSVEEQAQKMLHDDRKYKFLSGTQTIRELYGFSRDEPAKDVLCGVGADRPIYYVNWNESVEFCRRLSSRLNYRIQLPTEAQWEYACRAGSTTALPNGPIEIKGENNAPALDPIAWYGGNSVQGFTGVSRWNSSDWPEMQYPGGPCGTHPVGKKEPNAWGLYDMLGNVLEWCSDYYDKDYYAESPTSDPENRTEASPLRVLRGGGWYCHAWYCRSASRRGVGPDDRNGLLGLRVLLVPSSRD